MKFIRLLPLFVACLVLTNAPDALAVGDPEAGKKIAKKCTSCHTLDEGGKNGLGPNLYGIMGQPAGAVDGYTYSKALMESGLTWDAATFLGFVTKPKKVVKGTKMSFRGIKKPTQRADLLAYFQTLGGRQEGAAAIGDVAAGRAVAENHCVVCHTFEKGGKVVFGPNLFDIYGKPAAAIEGYEYSDALRNSGLVWNYLNLQEFLAHPEQFVPGTKARFPGLTSAQQKADILEYMKTLQ